MSVEIKISPIFSPYTDNRQTFGASGSTVGECLNQLVAQFPALKRVLFDKKGGLSHHIILHVNQVRAYPEPLARPVRDGDKIQIMMVIGGG
jgi:molybdopterin converting factor small subunit